MTSDRPLGDTDWSEPTLSEPTPAEPTPAEPTLSEPTLSEPQGEAEREPDADTQPEGEPEPTAEPESRPEPDPAFTFIPFAPMPVAHRPRTHYAAGRVPSWHAQLIERAADIAVAAMPIPLRVLDVGCGTGQLLGELVVRVPYADAYIGVDPDVDALQVAAAKTPDTHISYIQAAAEALPFPDATFDLVIATASFAYWVDQAAGAGELARVVTDNGIVILVDTLKHSSRRAKRARSMGEITRLLDRAGLSVGRTETVRRSKLGRPTTRAVVAFR